MDFVAVGYPSPLAAWAFHFLEVALRRIVPQLTVLRLDRFDTVADLGRHRGARLILSMFPGPDFAEACRSADIRTLVFADDPVEAVRYVQASHEITAYEALRPVSAGLVLAGAFARSAQGKLVARDIRGATADVLRELLAHFGVKIPSQAARAICRDIGSDDASLAAALLRAPPALPVIADEDRRVIGQVLDGLRAHLELPVPGNVTWPRQCFLIGDRPNASAPLALELTGRARIIYYGPYLHLPRGLWRVRVSIGFSQDVRGLPFSIEVCSTEVLGKARILADRGGIFSCEFEARVSAPHEPIEVRIMSDEGAIEGHMGLVGIDFTGWTAVAHDMPTAA